MQGLFQRKELAARKRELAAQNEAYRQALRAHLEDLDDHTRQVTRRFSKVRAFNPFLVLGMPAAGFALRRLFGKQTEQKARSKSKFSQLVKTAVIGWQTYRKLAPIARGLLRQAREMKKNRRFGSPIDWWKRQQHA